jgi:hypothetical protein
MKATISDIDRMARVSKATVLRDNNIILKPELILRETISDRYNLRNYKEVIK